MNHKIINPRYYGVLISQLIKFIISPNITSSQVICKTRKLHDILILYFINLFLSVIISFIIHKFFDYGNASLAKILSFYTPLMLILIGAIILPLVEEILFRLPLIFSPVNLSLSFSILSYYVVTNGNFHTYNSDIENHFILRLLIAVLSGVIMYFLISRYRSDIENFWKRNFRWIYYFSCIVFAWIHITNKEISFETLLLMPLLTIPQLIAGIILGFVRVRYGFIYNYFMHVFNNLTVLSIFIVFN